MLVDANEEGYEALRVNSEELVKGNTTEPARLQPTREAMAEPIEDGTRMEPETQLTELDPWEVKN